MSDEALDPSELAERVRVLLAAVESGQLKAGPTAVAYLHGALAALEALAGEQPFKLPEQDF